MTLNLLNLATLTMDSPAGPVTLYHAFPGKWGGNFARATE